METTTEQDPPRTNPILEAAKSNGAGGAPSSGNPILKAAQQRSFPQAPQPTTASNEVDGGPIGGSATPVAASHAPLVQDTPLGEFSPVSQDPNQEKFNAQGRAAIADYQANVDFNYQQKLGLNPSNPFAPVAAPPIAKDVVKEHIDDKQKLKDLQEQYTDAQAEQWNTDPQFAASIDKRIGDLADQIVSTKAVIAAGAPIYQDQLEKSVKKALAGDISDLTQSTDGFDEANPTGVKKAAQEISKQYGDPGDEFYQAVYNKLRDGVDMKVNEDRANKRYKELAAPILDKLKLQGDSVLTSYKAEFAKNATVIDSTAKVMGSQMDSELEPLQKSFDHTLATLDAKVKSQEDAYNNYYQSLQQGVNNGQLNADQANGMLQQQRASYEASVAQRNQAAEQLQAKLASDANVIRNRYNTSFAEKQKAIIDGVNKRVEQAQKEYEKVSQISPEDAAKLRDLYQESWTKTLSDKKSAIEATDRAKYDLASMISPSAAFAEWFAKQTFMGLGGSIKRMSTTVGSKYLYTVGEEMERSFLHPEVKSDHLTDLLDAKNLAGVSGQLLGGMLPSVGAAAIVAAGTNGVGAGVAARLVASSLSGWATETIDIAGGIKDQVFQKTGDMQQANDAAAAAWKSQIQLLPTYAFEGLPFVGEALGGISSKAGRIFTGALTEYTSELFQEIPQNIAQNNIVDGKPAWSNFIEGVRDSQTKQTMIQMLPILALGAHGHIGSQSNAQILEKAAKTYIAKSSVVKHADALGAQWMEYMITTKGDNFAKMVISSMYDAGHIDDSGAAKLDAVRQQVLQHLDDGKKAGLNKGQASVYSAFMAKSADIEQQAAKEASEPIKQLYLKKAKEAKADAMEILDKKEANYVKVTYANGGESVISMREAQGLFGDKDFAATVTLLGKDGITVKGYGPEGRVATQEFRDKAKESHGQQAVDALDPANAQLNIVPKVEEPEVEKPNAEPKKDVTSQDANDSVREAKTADKLGEGVRNNDVTGPDGSASIEPDAKVEAKVQPEKAGPVPDPKVDEVSSGQPVSSPAKEVADPNAPYTTTEDNGKALDGKTANTDNVVPRKEDEGRPKGEVGEDGGGSGEKGTKEVAPKAQEVDEIDEALKKLKFHGNDRASVATPFTLAWDAAIDAVRLARKGGLKLAEAIESGVAAIKDSDWYKGLTDKEKSDTEADFRTKIGGVEKPKEAVKEAPVKEAKEPKRVKKTFATIRAYEGEFRDEVKEEIKKGGLYRLVENQEEAIDRADKFIGKVGVEAALDAVKAGDVKGGAATTIWIRSMEAVQDDIMNSEDPQELQDLFVKQGEMVLEFSQQRTEQGQASAILNALYEDSELRFNSAYKADKWETEFGEKPTKEMMDKWREQDKVIADLNKKYAEAEKRANEAQAKAAAAVSVEAIKEAVRKEKLRQRTFTQKAEALADTFRKLKTTPIVFKGPDGKPIKITQAGYDWNELVELGAKAIVKTGQIADGVAAIVENLKGQVWYSALDDDYKAAIQQQIEDKLREVAETDVEANKIRIPKQMIRDAVAAGASDIDTLVAAIKEEVKEEYPEATDRDIRDAITEYGKVVNMSRDQLSTDIRRMKRIGKIVSALEDVRDKIRPLRSGLQRDKLDAEERALNKQLKDALKELPASSEAHEQELRTALDAAKTRARNRIEDLQREIDLRERIRRSTKSIEPDAELNALIEQKDALQKEHDKVFGDKSITEEERLKRVMDSTRRTLEKVEKDIKDKNLDPNKLPPVKESPELRKLRDSLDAARKEYTQMQEDAGIIDRKRLETAKKQVERRIQELRDRIANKEFGRKEPRPIVVDDELTKLNADKLRIQEEYDKEFYKHQLLNRSKEEKIKDAVWQAWGLTRALQATGEFSFIALQGGTLGVSNLWHNPKATGRAFKTMAKAFASEKNLDQWLREIKSQEWYPEAKKAGLALTEAHGEVKAREELFMSEWTNIIWDVAGSPLRLISKSAYDRWKKANIAKALERGAAGYLDTLRVERYLDGLAMLRKNKEAGEEITKQDYKDVADVANTLTGRASLGEAEKVASTLTKIFFSPRLWASAMKTATPYGLYHFGRMTPTARKMAFQDLGRFIGTTGALVAAAALHYNNDDDDETSVEYDPRSSDFMKVKINNTRIDPWGGKLPQVVMTTRLFLGAAGLFMGKHPVAASKNAKGEILPLGIQYHSPSLFDVGQQMVLNKLAPSASLIVDAARTKLKSDKQGGYDRTSIYGADYDLSTESAKKLFPIYWSGLKQTWEDNPDGVGAFVIATSFFGVGSQTYGDGKDKKNTKKKANAPKTLNLRSLQN